MDRPYDAVIGHALTATDHCEKAFVSWTSNFKIMGGNTKKNDFAN